MKLQKAVKKIVTIASSIVLLVLVLAGFVALAFTAYLFDDAEYITHEAIAAQLAIAAFLYLIWVTLIGFAWKVVHYLKVISKEVNILSVTNESPLENIVNDDLQESAE